MVVTIVMTKHCSFALYLSLSLPLSLSFFPILHVYMYTI